MRTKQQTSMMIGLMTAIAEVQNGDRRAALGRLEAIASTAGSLEALAEMFPEAQAAFPPRKPDDGDGEEGDDEGTAPPAKTKKPPTPKEPPSSEWENPGVDYDVRKTTTSGEDDMTPTATFGTPTVVAGGDLLDGSAAAPEPVKEDDKDESDKDGEDAKKKAVSESANDWPISNLPMVELGTPIDLGLQQPPQGCCDDEHPAVDYVVEPEVPDPIGSLDVPVQQLGSNSDRTVRISIEPTGIEIEVPQAVEIEVEQEDD